MAFKPVVVTVNGKPVRLHSGCTVKHALIAAEGSSRLVDLVEQGKAVVWDDTVDAATDLGGAIYNRQRLTVREV